MSSEGSGLSRWEARSERPVADCKIFSVSLRTYYHPKRDTEAEFSILYSPDWIQAVPVTEDGKIIMVNQYRFGRDAFSWEMPGGLLDKGEDPIAGALRELTEETGYTGENAQIIGTVSPNPAIQTNIQTFVFFENCIKNADTNWDQHEELEVGLFSMDDIQEMIGRREIHNSIAFNALFFLERHRSKS